MKKAFRFTVLADTHYYDASLGISGEAYALRSASDQKCLAETGAIIDAAFQKIAESDTQAVLIAGDLTNDGERICHEKMLEKLYRLQRKKPVFVTTATHDWCCDENPRRFDGEMVYHDVDTVSPEELYTLYADFGTKHAREQFQTHLGTASYLVDLADDVVLLALNDDQNGKGKAGYKPDHLQWILNTVRRENANGKTVIAMQHHLLYPHISPLVTGGACCGDRDELLELLSEAGLRFLFVGHSHLQHMDRYVSKNGHELYEINVGSLCGYPAPMAEVSVTDAELMIHTAHLDFFTYGGKTYDAQRYLQAHAVHLLGGVLDALAYGTRLQAAEKLSALGISDGEEFVRRYHRLLQPTAKMALTATVGKVGKVLNRLPGAPYFEKADLTALQNVSVLDLVYAVFLSALSGVPAEQGKSASTAHLLHDIGMFPKRLLAALHIQNEKAVSFAAALAHAMEELRTGGEIDNNHLQIKRRQE